MIKLSSSRLALILILLLGAFFRLYNLNWDSGHQLHPDERAIAMAVDSLKFPQNLTEFFSTDSPWNPHFFAYGSFPMYLLRVTGDALSIFDRSFGQFPAINLVGRFLSALADVVSIFILYKIGRKLFNVEVGLLASLFYAVSVLPIQLSHFYAVDTLLTCFILTTLYLLLLFYEKPGIKNALLIGVFFGISLATKVSAIVLIVSLGFALAADFLLIFLKKPHHPQYWLPHLRPFTRQLKQYLLIIIASTIAAFSLFEPYALIDFNNFWSQTLQQSELTKNAFYFPYTLQFVGKIPYLYELSNVFFWGLGPLVGTFAFLGIAYFFILIFKKKKGPQFAKEQIVFIFFLVYLLVVGGFAVGFMRYMLPIYPILALFAAVFISNIFKPIKSTKLRLIAYCLLLIACLLWPASFAQIYTRPNTRVQASEWIYTNIPPGTSVAVEHWDDQLPIGKPVSYNTLTLKLYDADTAEKWQEIDAQLAQANYIIIASNRLYSPLQKLTDCPNLPPNSCYVKTAEYYDGLFSGKMGFKKVAEFTSYPTIPLLNIPINDEKADESFTVFDHPKVMIFEKTTE
jgi:4-amino-4-deoxy-L-arabinose transferase-like glycosyltransferase